MPTPRQLDDVETKGAVASYKNSTTATAAGESRIRGRIPNGLGNPDHAQSLEHVVIGSPFAFDPMDKPFQAPTASVLGRVFKMVI